MKQICPICGKTGNFGYFETPDEKGIVGMLSHFVGTELGLFGQINNYNRCFVTVEQLEGTDWFDDFLKERQQKIDEEALKMDEEFEEMYLEMMEETK